jgi:hypothetical protein
MKRDRSDEVDDIEERVAAVESALGEALDEALAANEEFDGRNFAYVSGTPDKLLKWLRSLNELKMESYNDP